MQQSLKDVERQKAYFVVQVEASGKESGAKAKEVAASGRAGSEKAQGSAAVSLLSRSATKTKLLWNML